MANPKELEEAADAILKVRRLPAVRRHQELDGPLRQAEEWARKHYRKVTEQLESKKSKQPSPLRIVRPDGEQLKLKWS